MHVSQAIHKSAGRLVDLFRKWDANGDGVIDRQEFQAGYHDASGSFPGHRSFPSRSGGALAGAASFMHSLALCVDAFEDAP